MISYNPKDWFTFIFRIHKTETLQRLWPLLITVGVYSLLLNWLETALFSDTSLKRSQNLGVVYSILGFTLSLFLVFRTNTAYDRWWEGRKLWGQLINHSRNLFLLINTLEASQINQYDSDYRSDSDSGSNSFADRVGNPSNSNTNPETSSPILAKIYETRILIALFPHFLRMHLRDLRFLQNAEIPATMGLEKSMYEKLSPETKEKIIHAQHQPMKIADHIHQNLNALCSTNQLIMHSEAINGFMNISGACERIKNTPIPFNYSVFIKKFIFIYVMLFPLVYSSQLGYLVAIVTMFILYVLASIELIAEEIENPFNGDENDLPLEQFSHTIVKNAQN